MGDVPPQAPTDPKQTYDKPWFVLAVVAACAVAGLVIYFVGNSGNVPLTAGGEVVPTPPRPGGAESETPEPGTRDQCPDPGEPVEYEAAELVQVFAASATGGGFDDLAASSDVIEQVEQAEPVPPVTRMTRIRGWVGGPGHWSTCVLSSWTGSKGPMQSIDIVTASVVSGEERSDARSEDDDEERRGRGRDPEDLPDRWEITAWVRGLPEPRPHSRAVTIEFYNSTRACRRPDRPASVLVADGDPAERLLQALEELMSGTPGRASAATTRIPADVQVLESTVENGRARVVLAPTLDELSRCAGTAAYEQVRDTAAGIALETLPLRSGDQEDDREPDVEVVVDGDQVDTLRR